MGTSTLRAAFADEFYDASKGSLDVFGLVRSAESTLPRWTWIPSLRRQNREEPSLRSVGLHEPEFPVAQLRFDG